MLSIIVVDLSIQMSNTIDIRMFDIVVQYLIPYLYYILLRYNVRGRRDSPPKTSIRVPTVQNFPIRIQVNIFIVAHKSYYYYY